MKIILSQVNPSDFEADLLDMINRLSASEYINQKQSAINLISIIYKNFNNVNKNVAIK
jgi:hypothetical protein